MPQIKSYSILIDEFNKHITIAVDNVAKVICDKLRESINEQYYQDPSFYPNVYQRTEQFLRSAVYNMLNSNSAVIGIDTTTMRYKNGFSAQQVVEYAAQSMHGSPLYQTDTENFWDTFIEWCDKNVVKLLKFELKKQGIDIK